MFFASTFGQVKPAQASDVVNDFTPPLPAKTRSMPGRAIFGQKGSPGGDSPGGDDGSGSKDFQKSGSVEEMKQDVQEMRIAKQKLAEDSDVESENSDIEAETSDAEECEAPKSKTGLLSYKFDKKAWQ